MIGTVSSVSEAEDKWLPTHIKSKATFLCVVSTITISNLPFIPTTVSFQVPRISPDLSPSPAYFPTADNPRYASPRRLRLGSYIYHRLHCLY
ncbi:Uncharacterized protein HZ326_11787 [Fusarium oxysporum f. sp. albedinis]|nr:Uncharacterized protein HZ326_11787 [Fusarium oxysporum f. sp. albedinis]